jgi:hypothetical protein
MTRELIDAILSEIGLEALDEKLEDKEENNPSQE